MADEREQAGTDFSSGSKKGYKLFAKAMITQALVDAQRLSDPEMLDDIRDFIGEKPFDRVFFSVLCEASEARQVAIWNTINTCLVKRNH